MTGKTLKDLNVKVGDVVEYIPFGGQTTVSRYENGKYYGSGMSPNSPYSQGDGFRIISRAIKYTDWKFGIAHDGSDTHTMPDGTIAWRVKIEPEVGSMTVYFSDRFKFTYTTIDGIIDCASVKMELLT